MEPLIEVKSGVSLIVMRCKKCQNPSRKIHHQLLRRSAAPINHFGVFHIPGAYTVDHQFLRNGVEAVVGNGIAAHRIERLRPHLAEMAVGGVEEVRTQGDGAGAELRGALFDIARDDQTGVGRVYRFGLALEVYGLGSDGVAHAWGPLRVGPALVGNPIVDHVWVVGVVQLEGWSVLTVTGHK